MGKHKDVQVADSLRVFLIALVPVRWWVSRLGAFPPWFGLVSHRKKLQANQNVINKRGSCYSIHSSHFIPSAVRQTFRAFSHQSCLVWFKQTLVHFPHSYGLFGLVWIQQSHLDADQNNRTETSLKRWSRSSYKRTLVQFVCGMKAIRPQSDPSAVSIAHWWTRPAPVACSAVHETDKRKKKTLNDAKEMLFKTEK